MRKSLFLLSAVLYLAATAALGYVIKLLARNASNGRIGTLQTSFVIPNLERETTRRTGRAAG